MSFLTRCPWSLVDSRKSLPIVVSPVMVSSCGLQSWFPVVSPRMISRMVSPECLPHGVPCSPARRPNEGSSTQRADSRQCAEYAVTIPVVLWAYVRPFGQF